MAVDLADHIESLRREITPLGSGLYSDATEDDLLGYMTDAFWEARLDGFMGNYTCNEDGVVEHLTDPEKEFPRYLVGLIVLYAGIRVLRNVILNSGSNSQFRAKAGPVEFETASSASVLAEMLRVLSERRRDLLDQVENLPTPTFYFDAYTQRGHDVGAYWGHMTEYLVGLAN